MNGFYKQLIQILKEHGFAYLRPGKGSHELWSNGKIALSVPFNCYSRHTANKVLSDAGIKYKF